MGCRIVVSPAEVALHHLIRHEVFVTEQRVFDLADRDALDESPTTLKVLAYVDECPAGAVRLYPTDREGTEWKGDRLAVRAPFRRGDVGARLVDFAVDSGARRGGRRMIAKVQVANVRFFEGLGWVRDGDVEPYVGLPHQSMAIDLIQALSGREAR